jgi:hypothetical protein
MVSPRTHWVNLSFLPALNLLREDLRKLKRITLLWDYIRQVTEQNQGLLMGDRREMLFAD